MKLNYVISNLKKSLWACEELLKVSEDPINYFSDKIQQIKIAIELLEKYDGNN